MFKTDPSLGFFPKKLLVKRRDVDSDPHSLSLVDLDPHTIKPDPHPWSKEKYDLHHFIILFFYSKNSSKATLYLEMSYCMTFSKKL